MKSFFGGLLEEETKRGEIGAREREGEGKGRNSPQRLLCGKRGGKGK